MNINQVFAANSREEFNFDDEFFQLEEQFENSINSQIILDDNYEKKIVDRMNKKFLEMLGNLQLYTSQCFIYVDKNPKKQIIFVGIFDIENFRTYMIGVDHVSTGNNERVGYWETPSGIFVNSLKSVGYRALGTRTEEGWRGLGIKGSRVWDFGWQTTKKKSDATIQERKIRLLLHATDPDVGEQRLGRVESMGCVRMSAEMNFFLDHYGIIDAEYEKNAHNQKISWLLKVDREPTPLAGKFVIIEDSSEF